MQTNTDKGGLLRLFDSSLAFGKEEAGGSGSK